MFEDEYGHYFNFALTHMRPIELFVFWYPITMGLLCMLGGIITVLDLVVKRDEHSDLM